ncbi:MAG: PD-(D/E)XK nuclease family protein [Terrisporobacter othiniensis]|uniref:PD-(D/E)XK nuclease family protein n=1 Tax=Terrisporobacter othiniensis TaxID=1577792 RepID=UPI0029021C3D|nr:PD-(D/E)XK nuclease family protein [Terrisporobacter othiniensis]MDU2201216.1 PD-(D/E)XK nuclease family protein [Terrisporobacter othiniensis]
MNEKLKYFTYSQNSLNTYKSCPFKFKYKYIDNINWKYDDADSREYYDSLKLGREFHLLCERYFSQIPLGNCQNKEFNKWINKIKDLFPIKDENIYLPEYDLRLNLNNKNLIAKVDLVKIKKDSINLWDWKTENREITYKNVLNRMQTIVYLFLAEEIIRKNFYPTYDIENISMNYYQPGLENNIITINYNKKLHEENKLKILNLINNIESTDFNNENKINKNLNHCKYCEFNKLCNSEAINYEILEEDIYGS